jgi:dGTPase
MARTDLLPKQWRKDVSEARDETALARIVVDYIAGMTDRFAIQSHVQLLGGEALGSAISTPHVLGQRLID